MVDWNVIIYIDTQSQSGTPYVDTYICTAHIAAAGPPYGYGDTEVVMYRSIGSPLGMWLSKIQKREEPPLHM